MALQAAITGKSGEWDQLIPELLDVQCGYCAKSVAMQRVTPGIEFNNQTVGPRGMTQVDVWATYVCPRASCLKPTSILFVIVNGNYPYLSDDRIQIPRGQAEPMEGLPPEMQADRLEAWSCYYGGDHRAAMIMGRAAIQRAVRHLKQRLEVTDLAENGAGLKADLNVLEQTRAITRDVKDWADEVRIAGDDAAHPTTLGKISRAEATVSLDFMEAFLSNTVALPAKRASRKEERSGST